MTNEASRDEPKGAEVLTRFLQDWTTLWQEELQAQARDQEAKPVGRRGGMTGGMMSPELSTAMDLWRATMGSWAETLGRPPSSLVLPRERTATPRAPAGVAPPDPRDAEIERLARRVNELEARLARLEARRG
jgi:hypothetical protein